MNQNTINIIKTYFAGKYVLTKKRMDDFCSKYPQIKQQLEIMLNDTPQWLQIKYIIKSIITNTQLKKCQTCGKQMNYLKSIAGDLFCCKSCLSSNEQIKAKKRQTNIKNRGYAHPMQNPKIFKQSRIKFKQTCDIKYGGHYFKLQQFKNKCKTTLMQKYGVDNVAKLQTTKEKTKLTCLQKYGVDHPFKSQIVKNKKKLTNKSKYGSQELFSSTYFKDKMKKRNMQLYNVDFYQSTDQCKEKVRNTLQEKYGVSTLNQLGAEASLVKILDKGFNTILTWKQYVIPLFTREQYKGRDKQYRWKCVKCGNQFQQRIHTTHFNDEFAGLPRCLICYPYSENTGKSYLQRQVVQFCKQYFPDLIQNDRRLIAPYQIDILIPEIKLAIEFNGNYWHSIEAGYQAGYHLMKTNMCQKNNYRLIHIFEFEWVNNKEEIQQKLISIFENNETADISIPLNRCWYQLKEISGYNVEILQPETFVYDKYTLENCGYLKYTKNNN